MSYFRDGNAHNGNFRVRITSEESGYVCRDNASRVPLAASDSSATPTWVSPLLSAEI